MEALFRLLLAVWAIHCGCDTCPENLIKLVKMWFICEKIVIFGTKIASTRGCTNYKNKPEKASIH
jgi:hypothetical protein